LNEQAGSDQQNQRQCQLAGDERFAEAPGASSRRAGPFTERRNERGATGLQGWCETANDRRHDARDEGEHEDAQVDLSCKPTSPACGRSDSTIRDNAGAAIMPSTPPMSAISRLSTQ
jgi:hypothetical protein